MKSKGTEKRKEKRNCILNDSFVYEKREKGGYIKAKRKGLCVCDVQGYPSYDPCTRD